MKKTKKLTTINSKENVVFYCHKFSLLTYSVLVLAVFFFSNKLHAQPIPTVAISVIEDTIFCQNKAGQGVTFNVSGTAPYVITYNVNGGAPQTINTATDSSIFVTTPGVFAYSLISIQDFNYGPIPTSGSQTITALPLPIVSVVGNPKACEGDIFPTVTFALQYKTTKPYDLSYSVNGVLQPAAKLDFATDSLKWPQSTDIAGVYTYSLISILDGKGCSGIIDSNSSKAVVTINPLPNAHFSVSPQITSILEPLVTLTNTSDGATGYLWDFGDKTLSPYQNPGQHTYTDTATYIIKLFANNDVCQDSTFQKVIVYMPLTLYIPNAFTPNGDGVNDVFTPKAEGFFKYEMSIYDRWGRKIFHTNDINKGWDGTINGGKITQIDVGAYVINIVGLDKKAYVYYGTITYPE